MEKKEIKELQTILVDIVYELYAYGQITSKDRAEDLIKRIDSLSPPKREKGE